jgi:O-antigen ligase
MRNHLLGMSKLMRISIGAIILLSLAVFVVSQMFPGFLDFMGERFSEILDPTREDGTGKFRDDQRRTYFPMVLERPFFGWTFEGFEMKNPLVDWWPEKSGQHFHEGYMEMLFYHGFFGLILKYFYLIYLAFKAFSKRLSQESIILIAFSLAGLIFSFSYVLPFVFWAHVGLCLYYLERVPAAETNEEEPGLHSMPDDVEEVEYEEVHPRYQVNRRRTKDYGLSNHN